MVSKSGITTHSCRSRIYVLFACWPQFLWRVQMQLCGNMKFFTVCFGVSRALDTSLLLQLARLGRELRCCIHYHTTRLLSLFKNRPLRNCVCSKLKSPWASSVVRQQVWMQKLVWSSNSGGFTIKQQQNISLTYHTSWGNGSQWRNANTWPGQSWNFIAQLLSNECTRFTGWTGSLAKNTN